MIRTTQVQKRTPLLLVRFRYHIITKHGWKEEPLLAEDLQVLAFSGSPQKALWLDNTTAETLLQSQPVANIHPDQATIFCKGSLVSLTQSSRIYDEVAVQCCEGLLEAHRRVRGASRTRGLSHRVEHNCRPMCWARMCICRRRDE